jgi:hypothetical protein
MNVNPNPYPHGRWTPLLASPLTPAPVTERLERWNQKLYDKYWCVLESSLRAANEEMIRLVQPPGGMAAHS